jgi:uncharacterized lipoprotein YajG
MMTNPFRRLVSVAAVLLAAGCATPETILPMPAPEAMMEACTKTETRSALDAVGGGQERQRVARLCEAAVGICQRNLESANCQRDLRRYGFGK